MPPPGCVCEINCPGSLETVLCSDGVTAGPLVPCYNSGLAGTFFSSGGSCYEVTAIKNAANSAYSPDVVYGSCDDCANSTLFILLSPCGGGTGSYWVYVPTALEAAAAGDIVYPAPDGFCYKFVASNTKTDYAGVVAAGGTMAPAPTLTDCLESPCPGAPCTCVAATVTTVTVAAWSGPTCETDSPGAGYLSEKIIESYPEIVYAMANSSPCVWAGSPTSDVSFTEDDYYCTDDACADCTLISSTPATDIGADFGVTVSLETSPVCQWILTPVVSGSGGVGGWPVETKAYDGGNPLGTYSRGSVVS